MIVSLRWQSLVPGTKSLIHIVTVAIFIEMPEASISYIWQVTGCQHSLQPGDNDFKPPTVPALTPRGFSRWESVEILLGPEEHVPYMQFAAKNWDLRHPDTGERFPADLPADVFPRTPDVEVDLWHQNCGRRVAQEAAREKDESMRRARPTEPTEPRYGRPSAHSATPPGRPRSDDSDYFGRSASYTHIPERQNTTRARHSRSPEKSAKRSPSEERARRRSFSDFSSIPRQEEEREKPLYDQTYLDPSDRRPPQGRRNSHPRRYSTSEDEIHLPASMSDRNRRRHRGTSPPIPSIRRVVPPADAGSKSTRPIRADVRSDDARRSTGLSPLGSLRHKLSETVSSILPNGLASDRSKPASRHHASSEHLRPRRSKEQFTSSRLSKSYSDVDTDDEIVDDPADELRRRRRKATDDKARDSDRERDRYKDRGDRERVRESDRERDSDRDRMPPRDRQRTRRPDPPRRTSSHADADRRRDAGPWDMSYRDRMKEERRRWDRRPSADDEVDMAASAMPAGNRRYPEPSYS